MNALIYTPNGRRMQERVAGMLAGAGNENKKASAIKCIGTMVFIMLSTFGFAQVNQSARKIADWISQSQVTIVGLGEASHADGTTFKLKVDQIKYLHEKCGFNVIMFESPILNMEIANREINFNSLALLNGIYGIWGSKELEELSVYVKSTRSTKNPIQLWGFDCQNDNSATENAGVHKNFMILIDSLNIANKNNGFRDSLNSYLDKYLKYSGKLGHMKRRDTTTLVLILNRVQNIIIEKKLDTVQFFSSWIQIIKSITVDVRQSFQNDFTCNMRDSIMAVNVAFYRNLYFSNQKIILWAATGHLGYSANFMQDSVLHLNHTMGDFLRKQYAHEYASVGYTAYSGKFGTTKILTGRVKITPGSIESYLHANIASLDYHAFNLNSKTIRQHLIDNNVKYSYLFGHYRMDFDPNNPNVDYLVLIEKLQPPDHLIGRFKHVF